MKALNRNMGQRKTLLSLSYAQNENETRYKNE